MFPDGVFHVSSCLLCESFGMILFSDVVCRLIKKFFCLVLHMVGGKPMLDLVERLAHPGTRRPNSFFGFLRVVRGRRLSLLRGSRIDLGCLCRVGRLLVGLRSVWVSTV